MKSTPLREAIIEESPDSQVKRLLALDDDWVKWRCPIDAKELDLNFVDPHRFPRGLNGAGWCEICQDKIWLRDADSIVHPYAQRAFDREFEEQYRKAREA